MIDRIDAPRRSALMPFPTAAARTLRVVPLLALLCLFAIGGHAQADGNILINGDLTKGSGNQPDHWHTDAWKNEASFTTYHWNHEGSVNELEISSSKPNDARWAQPVHLGPGWYHFTADIRTEGVGQDQNLGGACLSILEDGIVSQQLRGTNNWQTVGWADMRRSTLAKSSVAISRQSRSPLRPQTRPSSMTSI
jgi:hypothetical protein